MEKNKLKAHIIIFAANILFGLNIGISRGLMDDVIDPIALTYLRIVGAGFLFWLFGLFVKHEKVDKKDLIPLFFAGTFALTTNQLPFFIGLSHTSPIDASLVITLLPIASMLLAALIQKEPITLKKAIGVGIGASGALLLVLSQGKVSIGGGNAYGNVIILFAVVSFALYLTLFKRLIAKYSVFTLMKWMFLFAAIQCLPFCYGAMAQTDFASIALPDYLRIFYVVVIATFVTYSMLPIGQKALRPTTLSMYNYTQPIVASIAAVVMGLSDFGIEKIISGILVFTGVYLVTRSKSREEIEKERQKAVN
jgi:drug/metabolite transporter (DMT)-like permease